MIEVNGFTIKNVKTPVGREGYGLVCEIFYKGKKCGECNDYGDGSVSNVWIDKEHTDLWEKAKDTFYKKFPDLYDHYLNDDSFVSDLAQFKEDEKQYKAYSKRGYPYLVRVDFTDWTQVYCGAATLDVAKKYAASKKNVAKVTYYSSLDEFKIVA